ncbi:MAG: hypothetical protein ABI946_04200 [Chthoniobacterales bacterium]
MRTTWQEQFGRRLRSSRTIVLVAAGLLSVLIVLGGLYLRSKPSSASDSRTSDAGTTEESALLRHTPEEPALPPDTTEESALPQDPKVGITDLEAKESSSPMGRTFVTVKVGVAATAPEVKDEVEVRIFFFDLSPANELRPTTAQVGYKWMTAVLDWTDPEPKFLVASYQANAASEGSPEKVRFGGFLVRLLVKGQVQDERSEPAEIAAAVRSGVRPIVLTHPPVLRSVSLSEIVASRRTSPADELAAPGKVKKVWATPTPTPSPEPTARLASAVPYGSPAPGKPGFAYSPHGQKFLIDVRGFPPGTEVRDPNTGKSFLVPER